MHQGVKSSLLWGPVSWQHRTQAEGWPSCELMGLAQWYPALLSQCSEQLLYMDFRDQVCCGRCLSCTWIIPLVSDHSNNSAQPYCRAGILTQSPYGDSNLRRTAMETTCKVSVLGLELYFYTAIAICEGLFFPHCIARDLQKKLALTILVEGGWIILGADFLSTAF